MASPTKLLLFDIDGTLVKAASGKILIQVMMDQLGCFVENHRDVYLGGADLSVVPELLKRNNIQVDDVDGVTKEILQIYDQQVTEALKQPGEIHTLPGADALLDQLNKDSQYALGLVTGNTKAGAYAKLTPPGLHAYFNFGAFGDDHGERDLLPPLALQRANEFYSTTFSTENTWIIGDTPKDIRCAKANDLRCLAVASGWIDAQTLTNHQPDAVVDDLCDPEQILEILNQ